MEIALQIEPSSPSPLQSSLLFPVAVAIAGAVAVIIFITIIIVAPFLVNSRSFAKRSRPHFCYILDLFAKRSRPRFWYILDLFGKDRDLLFFNSRSFSKKIENCLYCVFPLFLDLFGKDRGPIFIQFSIFLEKIEEPFLFNPRSFLKRSRTHFYSILDLF